MGPEFASSTQGGPSQGSDVVGWCHWLAASLSLGLCFTQMQSTHMPSQQPPSCPALSTILLTQSELGRGSRELLPFVKLSVLVCDRGQ
jgi:hypothetical protein